MNDWAETVGEGGERVCVYSTKADVDQESILPNFHFSGFPIFADKLESL